MTSPENTNAPPSRVSTSDSPQAGPVPLFDQHLKYLQDSYLSFFLERAKIEENYVDALMRLHKKAKSLDTYLDDRSEPSSVRKVWAEIRDGVEREAQSRLAFLQAMNVDVITPISNLKETQDRTRKRIKEDIKESSAAHQEYADVVLPRLKRQYFKKCQEVEENKANALSPTIVVGQDTAPMLAPTRSNPNTAPVVTSPQPLRPLSRRASGHVPQPRNRSPSTSNPLQDLAHQGKRQLNQLMTFLDSKGGNVKEGLGGVRSDAAVRTVKAKREADEADKEYRKGVHWLETLRIRRKKIVEGAFKSLELFIEEASQTMKIVLEKYTHSIIATSTTQVHLATHAQDCIKYITPQKDIIFITPISQRYLDQTNLKRVLYTNYYIGDCNDLIFGVSLVDYATARGLQEGEIPKIVQICIQEVEKRGLNSEGVYRVSGRHAIVQDIMHKIEKDERNFQFSPTDDVFVIASLLKQYLRELPEPVFKFPLEDRVKHTEDLGEHLQNNFLFLRGKMRRLPPIHQSTLKAIVEHLSHVAANYERNKMDAKNLAIIFSSVIFGEDEVPKQVDLLSIQSWKDSLMEDLITHASVLFDDRPPPATATSSHPLPPPPDERPTSHIYGSSYTQVASVPPRHHKSDSRGSQDFTPQLPPRPSNSIHPSRRAANQSSRTIGAEIDELAPGIASSRRPSASRGDEAGSSGQSMASDATTIVAQPTPVQQNPTEPTPPVVLSAPAEDNGSSLDGEYTTPPATPGSASGSSRSKSPRTSRKIVTDSSGDPTAPRKSHEQ